MNMNTIRRLNTVLKRLRRNAPGDPGRDWLMLMTLFLIAFAAILVWAAWAFDTVSRGGTIGSSAIETPPIFDKSSLAAIRTTFEKRAAEEAKYETGAYHFIDPSQ
ncbi:hypothetical protein KGM48_03060 [Patescibacteria group bacterium]|nr:hypothetical protein [Patescibacteria group bacterium]